MRGRAMIDEQVRQYVETLRQNRIAVWRIYLFGSHAKGRAGAASDIDLAVFWDRSSGGQPDH